MLKSTFQSEEENFSHDQELCFFIANAFGKSFTNYKTEYFFDKPSKTYLPLVKIPSKTKVYASLPYAWPVTISKNQTFIASSFSSIVNEIKPDVFQLTIYDKLNINETKALKLARFSEEKVVTHRLQLANTTFEAIFNEKITSKTRNQCRKALKSDLEFSISQDQDDIIDYFKIYNETAKNWDKNYNTYPLEFFKQIIKNNMFTDFWVAKNNNKLVAGIITVKYENRIFYWASALNREYSKLCPVNGLLYNALKLYTNNGYEYFDFGANPIGEGVSHFKKNFGAEDYSFSNYFYYSKKYILFIKPLISIKKIVLKVFKN